MIEHINKLFLIIIILSTLTYFQRADYNLPLFVFTLILWSFQQSKMQQKVQKQLNKQSFDLPDFAMELMKYAIFTTDQKPRLWYLMTFSLLTDAIWIIYWGVVWNSYDNRQIGTCIFTLIISIISFFIKISVVVILFLYDTSCQSALANLPMNIKSIYGAPPSGYEQL